MDPQTAYLQQTTAPSKNTPNDTSGHQTQQQAAAAAGAPPPIAEDAVQDGGDAIDTFSSYIPTALPRCIVEYLKAKANNGGDIPETTVDTNDAASTLSAAAAGQEVIELSEDELEILQEPNIIQRSDVSIQSQPQQYTTTANEMKELFTTTTTTTILQSHTSPSVESALLSSVSAPPAHDSAADVALPLVKEGKLSLLQAEGVCLAVGRFNRVFCGDDGRRERAGEIDVLVFLCVSFDALGFVCWW
jgi:hypothetical protein